MLKIIIAAKSDNHVIGKDGDVPWHMPADLVFFEQTIADGWLLSGRRSYESAQGDFIFKDGCNAIIITRRQDYDAGGFAVANSLKEGIQKAEKEQVEKLYILGGGEIYRQAMDIADRLIITEIHTTLEGDTFFPEIDTRIWEEVQRDDHPRDAENPYDYSFVIWERKH